MLFSAAAPLISLSFFSSFAVAQSAPNCSTDFGTSWDWSYNSLGQNPCMVASYMITECVGVWIGPVESGYTGPDALDGSNKLCLCSTVTYSLLSACGDCQGQGATLISWSQYAYNCTTTSMPPGSFPDPIPAGTRLPQWALLDVTSENHWNVSKSQAVGDTPELGPGTIPSGPSGPASTGPTNANSATPMPISGQSSNTGAIIAGGVAGGVAGGLAAISIVVAALLFYLRRRNPPAPSAPHQEKIFQP
ncbi:hypothetical protein F5888DRAFT_1665760 [Russula emetica]|nr:hypothetical protein F5888DRAFT_1665760 [Russula emetica]